MPSIVESGLSVTLPAGMHFRFADAAAYKAVCGHGVKEMDFAWVANGKLFLLEVRDYTATAAEVTVADLVPEKGQPQPFRFSALVDKITDSVMMMLSAWSGTKWGSQLNGELPAAAQIRMPLKIVVAIELPAALKVHLQALRDSLNARLKGRLAVADIGSVVLMDYDMLVSNAEFGRFITRQP